MQKRYNVTLSKVLDSRFLSKIGGRKEARKEKKKKKNEGKIM